MTALFHWTHRPGRDIIRTFQGICFDLFSTLVHQVPGRPFLRNVAQEIDVDLEQWKHTYDELYDKTMEGTVPGIVERICLATEMAGVSCSTDAVRAAVKRHFPDMMAGFKVDTQAVPLLRQIREQGHLLALVSNASDHAEWIFDGLGLRRYFDVTVFSYRVKKLKPRPGIYLHTIDQLGIPGSSCAFIGDGQHHELLGARDVGMATILVDRQLPHSGSAQAEADLVVTDLAAVPDALSALSTSSIPLRN